MFEAEQRDRRNAAQAASDALDPFHFDVELDDEEEDSDKEKQESDSGEQDTE